MKSGAARSRSIPCRPTVRGTSPKYACWVQAERAVVEMGKRDMLTGGLMIKTSNGNAIQNPLVGTANKAASDMVRYAAEFGMTPRARVRLAVDGSGVATSKWTGLIGGAETGS